MNTQENYYQNKFEFIDIHIILCFSLKKKILDKQIPVLLKMYLPESFRLFHLMQKHFSNASNL